MKAIILSAGEGTRLRPLTDTVPKTMVPIGGKPLLEHTIVRLRDHGFRELFINLHYLPEVIQAHFEDGGRFGVCITYAYEQKLLGTAGAVRNFAPHLGRDPVLVVYGDNLTDCDFSGLWRFHQGHQGVVTIAVIQRRDVYASGIVVFDEDGRIYRMAEKPDEVFSHWVNAGIYVLDPSAVDLIPEGVSDFGHDVFPDILARGMPMLAFPMEGYVFPIDTLAYYRKVQELWEKGVLDHDHYQDAF